MVKNVKLEQFYDAWSRKSEVEIFEEIAAAKRKADVIAEVLYSKRQLGINRFLDFGCGYGAVLARLAERLGSIGESFGIDYSKSAIDVANKKFRQSGLAYHRLPSLDLAETMMFLEGLIPDKVDCVLLVDLLEHVPDCKSLVAGLAGYARYFVVKLPIEKTFLDNYVLPKEYPSSIHSNGHLREFNANDVFYFIRKLGLTPVMETLYVYGYSDLVSSPAIDSAFHSKLLHIMLGYFRFAMSRVLPKKLFLSLVGGGGYICLATFDQSHVLSP